MNFFNWFKKKKYDIGVIRYGDSIVIPGREYFEKEDDIKILEECKQHYLSKLYQRKAITTLDFNSNELKEDMKRNVSLIVHLLLDNENFYLLSPEEQLIQSGKLRIYYEEIARLEKLTITRLVVLKEIEKSEQVPRHNRMALVEEINLLSTILQMYSYQKPAIAMELKNYFDVLSTRDLKDEEAEKIILQERLNRLLFITDGIVDTSIIEGDMDIKSKIVLLEILCEKYAYQNKKEIRNIKNYWRYYLKPLMNFPGSLEVFINEIEKKYLLFNEYGNKAITDDEVKRMYKEKFKQVFYTILDTDRKYNFDEDYGYAYYKTHLEESIDCILRGKCESFNKDFEDLREATNIFRDYLLDEDKMIDIEKILKDRNKLKLILTYENGMGFHTYLDKAKLQDFNNLYKEPGIEFSLNAKMIEVLKYVSRDNPIHNHPLYTLFLLKFVDGVKVNLLESAYILPSGLESFDFNTMNWQLCEKIITFCKDRVLYCPNSLTKMYYGDLFEQAKIHRVVINPNLETLASSQSEQHIQTIDAREIDQFLHKYENLAPTLVINNYKSSKLLCDRENAKNLFIYYYCHDDHVLVWGDKIDKSGCLFRFSELELYEDNKLKFQEGNIELSQFYRIYRPPLAKDEFGAYTYLVDKALKHLQFLLLNRIGYNLFAKSEGKVKKLEKKIK